ncbi:MAG: NYN domain-containing protein [Salinisphaeraceae bacterium]|nr:NYN domain-containing protein [Salinisphaeraceae bacterium]
MRLRRIAVLIDGGFFLKRLPKLVEPQFRTTAEQVADSARFLCKKHVMRLTGMNEAEDADGRWLDQAYRFFYYDAEPFAGKAHHPLSNQSIDFAKTDTAKFRRELFTHLRRKRKFALRLGHVSKEGGWQIASTHTKRLLKVREWAERIEHSLLPGQVPVDLSENDQRELVNLLEHWKNLSPDSVYYGLRQKGVDMRIGLDISSLAHNRQADTIILVTGDSDFVPAAKLARREGMEFIVDPLWQKVSDELYEHVDGIISVYPRPDRV